MCVQDVNNKNSKSCLSHINQKRRKEQNPTAFWLEVNQKRVKILY